MNLPILDPAAPSLETLAWAADQTLRMHTQTPDHGRPPGCKQCPRQGPCPQRSWADRVLAYYRNLRQP